MERGSALFIAGTEVSGTSSLRIDLGPLEVLISKAIVEGETGKQRE